jgi:hypothetical protein
VIVDSRHHHAEHGVVTLQLRSIPMAASLSILITSSSACRDNDPPTNNDAGESESGDGDGDPGDGDGDGEPGDGDGEPGDGDGEIPYPPAVLCPEEPHDDPLCGPAFDPDSPLDPEQLEQALIDGLEVWRYPGEGGACVGCHSPDGIELARVGYADVDIHRRAVGHVDVDQADTLVTYVHALRQQHEMTWLLHPAKFRPLQPAHLPFAETTPGLEVTDPAAQVERDEAFLLHLQDELALRWATDTIDSLAKAHTAYDELLAIDLVNLQLGVPFDHLSEDGFHGEPHLSVFEWFPGMASAPADDAQQPWFALHDAYLADPSAERLWAYYDQTDAMTGCIDDLAQDGDPEHFGRACEWMRLKWRSLQVFQHMLRHTTHAYPELLVDQGDGATIIDNLDLVIARNPIWEAGDFVRVQPLQRPPGTACFSQPALPCTLLPAAVDATVHSNPSYEEARIKQSEVFQQSWFVMSWLRDPALLYESHNFATFIGDYLESVLLAHYDVHHAFIVAKTSVEKSAASEWFGAEDFRQGTGKVSSVRTFSFKQLRNNLSQPTDNSPRRAGYDRMLANFARMWIHLVEEDLQLTGEIYDRNEVLYAIRYMRTWIEQLEGQEDAQINALVLSIESLAAQAIELRTQAHRDAYPGTGLQPTGDWDEFAAPYTG